MSLINDCYSCIHKRTVPGDAHISCANPDISVQGNTHAIIKGWFFYPFLFDPAWMETKCADFQPQAPKNNGPTTTAGA